MAVYKQVDTLLQSNQTVPIPTFQKGTVSISSFLLQNWLVEAFDAYVLDDADLGTVLSTAEGYAKAYQECTASLPPLALAGPANSAADTLKPYINCATKIDARLKPVLDPMVNNQQ